MRANIGFRLCLTVLLNGCGYDALMPTAGGKYVPGTEDSFLQLGEEASSKNAGQRFFMVTQSFVGRFSQEQDFLFVIDNSGSMGAEIDQVRQSSNRFIERLNQRRVVNFQVAVTTTDARYTKGDLVRTNQVEVVKSATSRDPSAEWRSLLSNVHTTATAGKEMGLRSAELAIRRNGSKFLRSGVPLAIVILSDEEDQSQGPKSGEAAHLSNGDALPVGYFLSWLKTLGRPTQLFPIVADRKRPCASNESYGDRYQQLMQGFGVGQLGSICNAHLEGSLNQISDSISERGVCMELSSKPTGESVSVWVDGTRLSDDSESYQIDKAQNLICFPSPELVRQDTQVRVSYEAVD